MPSAIKLVKHAERGSRHAKKIEMRENTNNADSVAVMNLSKAFENKNADVALDMLKQPSVLGRLMRADKKRDIVCFYALHAVLLLVKDKDCNAVLQQMTDTDIEDLKLLLRIAKSKSCPDQDQTLDYLSSMLVKFGKGDVVSDTMITSVRLYLDVSHVWEKSVVELDKWTDATDNFERAVPTKKWLTLKELSDLLGFAVIDKYYDCKQRLSVLHPEIETWFENYGKYGKLFDASHFQELKQLFDEMEKNDGVPAGCWTIVQLADKMGLNDQTDDKKREHISQIKTTVKRKYPQIVEFFTPNCRYFRAECFGEWQRLRALAGQRGNYNVKKRAEKPVKKAVAEFDPNKHYNKDQLAEVCGYKNGKILSTVVSTLKTKNDDFAKLVADCFIGVTNTKNKKYMIAFKIEKLAEFKAFLPHIVAENTKKALDSDNIISMENLAEKLGWSIATLRSNLSIVLKKAKPERKAEINSWFVSSDIKKSYKSGIKIEFVDEVVKLFDGGRKHSKKTTSFVRTPVKAIEKSAKVVKKAKKQKKRSVDAAEIKAALDKVLVKPGDSMVVVSEPELVESKPMTLLDVVALEKMLTAWNEMLAAATQERDAAEQNYKDVSAQVLTVKNAAERGDMLKQMMSANDAVLAAADNVREIQEKIDRANALKQERAEAARILAEKDALIAAFLKEASVNKK